MHPCSDRGSRDRADRWAAVRQGRRCGQGLARRQDDRQPTTPATAPAPSRSRSKKAKRPPTSPRPSMTRRGQERRRVRRRGERQPAVDVDPGRVLPAAREDGGQEALELILDTKTRWTQSGDDPRGQAVDRSWHARRETGFSEKRCRRPTRTDRGVGLPAYARATRRATCSRPPTASPRTRRRRRSSRLMVDAFKQAAPTPTTRAGRPPNSASRRTSVLTVASLVQAEAVRPAGPRPRSQRHLQPARRGHAAAARLDPALCRSTQRGDQRRRPREIDSPYNTYQHTGLPADADRLARRRRDQRRAPPRRHDLALLRDGQPAYRQDAVREHLRRAPAERRHPPPVLRHLR